MRLLRVSLCGGLATALLVLTSSATAAPWQKIAAEGEPGPNGLFGSLILAPLIADDGSVSFIDVPQEALLSPPSYSVWRWAEPGEVEPLATIVPPLSSTLAWWRPQLFADSAGNLAWREGRLAELVDCGEGGTSTQPRERLYELPRGGEWALSAETGTAAPGQSQGTIARLIGRVVDPAPPPAIGQHAFVFVFPPPTSDASGALSFYAHIADDPCFSGSDTELPAALFAPDDAGETTLVVREGDAMPGEDGTIVRRILDFERLVEPTPAVLVLAATDEAGAEVALLRWTSAGGLDELARAFAPSAFAGGETFAAIQGLTSHASGQIAFLGFRAAEDGETPDPEGLAVWGGDADAAFERWPLTGAVPGAPEGAVFLAAAEQDDTVADPMIVNGAGEVAFVVAFDPGPEAPPTLGLFAPDTDGAPRLRFAVGDIAPGLGGKRITSATPLHLSGDGTLLAFVIADAEGFDQDAAWYLLTPSAPPRLLLRASDSIEIAPGDLRSLFFRTIAYDDSLARIAVRVGQTGSEPEAIAVRAVPETGTALGGVGSFVTLGLLGRRRRRIGN